MKNRHFSKDGDFFVLKGGVYGLEVKINKEIRNYTESMFFGLSMRQFLFSALACGILLCPESRAKLENTLRVSLYAQDAGRVIDFDHRPFKNVEVIDEAMISLWNQRVNHDDNVYILGDFCYRNEKSAEWYLSQLKGHKHLVLGSVPLSDVGMEWLLQRSLALLWSYSR